MGVWCTIVSTLAPLPCVVRGAFQFSFSSRRTNFRLRLFAGSRAHASEVRGLGRAQVRRGHAGGDMHLSAPLCTSLHLSVPLHIYDAFCSGNFEEIDRSFPVKALGPRLYFYNTTLCLALFDRESAPMRTTRRGTPQTRCATCRLILRLSVPIPHAHSACPFPMSRAATQCFRHGLLTYHMAVTSHHISNDWSTSSLPPLHPHRRVAGNQLAGSVTESSVLCVHGKCLALPRPTLVRMSTI